MKQLTYLTLLLSVIPANALDDGPLTLSKAVETGLKTDNVVMTEAARVRAAKAGLEQTRLSRLGGFKLKGLYTNGNEPVYAFASAMKQGTFGMGSLATINDPASTGNYMAGIEAGVPLFTAFAATHAMKIGSLGVEAAQNGFERAKAGITFKITYQWLTVLLRAKLAALAAETVKQGETELQTARMLKDKGMVLGSDYYGAEAILSSLRGYSLNWNKALELEKEKLAIALGAAPAEGIEARGTLADADYPGKVAGDPAARRDIKALEKMAAISLESRAMQKDSFLPVVEVFGNWEANSRSLSDLRGSRLLGLRLTMPLGDPGYYAKKDAAKAEADMASSRVDEARKQAAAEIAETRNNYDAARESLPIAKETVKKASQSLELFRPLYRQGRQSVLEVLRAQASVLQAEAAYYETIYRLHLYHAQTLLATEALDAAAIKEMSDKLAGKE